MKLPVQWFIGYDSAQTNAAMTCFHTLSKYVDPVDISFVVKSNLEREKLFWGEHEGSTEFSQTRWLVPCLSGYRGTSVFMDSDFLWLRDPTGMLEYNYPDKAVTVVQHDLHECDLGFSKMMGKEQVWYPKKNWSSLMIFNNYHPDCKTLTPEVVSGSDKPKGYFHQFMWTDSLNPVSIPKEYNTLVGYQGYDFPNPIGVHFTDGGPWLGGSYEEQPYAQEYFNAERAALFELNKNV